MHSSIKILIVFVLPFFSWGQTFNHAYILGDWGNHRYFISKEKFSFWEAEMHIQSIDSSIHLLSVHSFIENMYVFNQVQSLIQAGKLDQSTYPAYYWLGGSDEVSEGIWEWLDDTPWDYDQWETDSLYTWQQGPEPNNAGGHEHYLMGNYYSDGNWNDATNDPGDLPFHYVFKKQREENQDTNNNVISTNHSHFIFPTLQRAALSKFVFQTTWRAEVIYSLRDSNGRMVDQQVFEANADNLIYLPVLANGVYHGTMKNGTEIFQFKIVLTE